MLHAIMLLSSIPSSALSHCPETLINNINRTTFVSLKSHHHHHHHHHHKVKASCLNDDEKSSSLYELLGVSKSGTVAEIKQAYKQLARKYHPDVCPAPQRKDEYTKRFIKLQHAYHTLSDPYTRAVYDNTHFTMSITTTTSRFNHNQDLEIGEWRKRWQSQLAELIIRSKIKDINQEFSENNNNMSWAATVRKAHKHKHKHNNNNAI